MSQRETTPTISISKTPVKKVKEEPATASQDQEATVAKAQEETEKLTQMPTLPKDVKPKQLAKLQDHIIDTQRKTIDSLMALLKQKDAFIKEWEAWITSVRECSESIKQAGDLLRNIDNKKVEELEKALNVSRLEVGNLNGQVVELKQRVRLLLGQ